MAKKTFTAPLELKADGAEGEFKAVFSTFNVVDLDGDVTTPGAFEEQAAVVEPWNHGWTLPAGKGQIKSDGKEAWIEGQFFLDTEVGKENYQTVKNLGSLAEWSYTFDIVDLGYGKFNDRDVRFLKKLDVVGVSPVTRGAGIDTRTASIKGQKRAMPSHSTPTTDVAWNGPANEARLREGESAAYYRRAYAWQDPEGDSTTKAAYKFIHHMVDGDGNIGAANMRACSAGIAALNGGRGGTTIPEEDMMGVHRHLAAHMMDADMEPPELKSLTTQSDPRAGGGGQTPLTPQGGEGGTPSGVGPAVVLAEIELIELGEI